MKTRLLIIVAIIVVTAFWFNPFYLTMSNEIIFSGFPDIINGINSPSMSAYIVTLIVVILSVSTWTILSWVNHRKSILRNIHASLLLGIIIIVPVSGIVGPSLAIILGVVTGSCLYIFELWRKRK